MEQKVLTSDFVDFFVKERGLSRDDAKALVKTFFDIIDENLSRDKYVKVKGLGTFKLVVVDARESVNVNTGERFEIGQHAKVSFTPDTSLKNLINRPFADFETVVLEDSVNIDGVDETPVEISEVPDVALSSEVDSVDDAPAENIIVFDDPVADCAPENPETSSVVSEGLKSEIGGSKPEMEGLEIEKQRCTEEPQLVCSKADSDQTVELRDGSASAVSTVDEDDAPKGFFSQKKKILTAAAVVLLVVISYLAGSNQFFGGNRVEEKLQAQRIDEIRVSDSLQQAKVRQEAEKRKADSVAAVYAQQKAAEQAEIEAEEKAKEEAARVAEQQRLDEKKIAEKKAEDERKAKAKLPKGVLAFHTLKRGESLRSIAKQYYGDKKYYTAIVRYNGIKNPDVVEIGMKLTIPDIKK